jgi:hypothetical protein
MYEQEILDAYMRMHPNVDATKVMQIIQNKTRQHFRDIPCKMDNNMTHQTYDTTMTKVFEWIETSNPIVTGNATYFMQH